MNKILYIIFIFHLLGCDHPESKKYNRYDVSSNSNETTNEIDGNKVIGVKDGDTFVVLIDGKEQVIRLAHIDCPEKKQPFGTKSKQFASDLCFGKNVMLNHSNKYDRYKRLIAEVVLYNGTNINKELVSNGLAWHFKKYSDNQEYAKLEIDAKNKQIGIWGEPNPTAPWDWRKR